MNINEAKLVSFVTSLVKEELDEYSINRLTVFIKECQSKPIDLKPLFDYMISNRKIEAIKEHRRLTGSYLKESKDEVERIMDRIKGELDARYS